MSENMVPTHCPNCGAAITEENNGQFCLYCGGKLPEAVQNITNNYDNRVENHYHTTNVYQVQAPVSKKASTKVSYQLPEDQRKAKINTVFVTGLFIGILIIISSIVSKNWIFIVLGAVIALYGATRKKHTNYCPSCFAPKDFYADRCTHCNKKFQRHSKIISGGFIFFSIIAILILIISITMQSH